MPNETTRPDATPAPDRSDAIYEVEDTVPVGSVDKARMEQNQTEQYPIPSARPIPWKESD